MIVVDASAVVKWFFNEPFSDEAISLLHKGCKLFAPDILQTEVANALCRRAVKNEVSKEQVEQHLERWYKIIPRTTFSFITTYTLLLDASKIALKFNHRLPDCLYLALAQKNSYSLASFDVKQKEIAQHLNITLHPFPSF